MARNTRLTVLQPFRADADVYAVGEEVPMAKAKKWSDGTLDRRVRSGFLRIDVVNDAEEQEAEDQETKEAELEEMTKAELVEYGEERGFTLAASLTKAEMIEELLNGSPEGEEEGTLGEAELEAMTKDELVELAKERGFTLATSLTKAEMVEELLNSGSQ